MECPITTANFFLLLLLYVYLFAFPTTKHPSAIFRGENVCYDWAAAQWNSLDEMCAFIFLLQIL